MATKKPFPAVVCLCGSTRFMETFKTATERETLDGKIVLSVGVDLKTPSEDLQSKIDKRPDYLPILKARLDSLHLRKIDLSDEILVINPGGYVGESTLREIAYAVSTGKAIRFWEQPQGKDAALWEWTGWRDHV
jgi:hypothetical protein